MSRLFSLDLQRLPDTDHQRFASNANFYLATLHKKFRLPPQLQETPLGESAIATIAWIEAVNGSLHQEAVRAGRKEPTPDEEVSSFGPVEDGPLRTNRPLLILVRHTEPTSPDMYWHMNLRGTPRLTLRTNGTEISLETPKTYPWLDIARATQATEALKTLSRLPVTVRYGNLLNQQELKLTLPTFPG